MMKSIDYNVQRTNLYEQIAENLEKAILSSSTAVAQRLPSEQELARQFNVSRTVIREALKILRERGLITQKNGGGSYVSKPNIDVVSNAINRLVCMENIDNDNLHTMRIILEVAAGRLAAEHADEEDFAHLQRIIDSMRDRSLDIDERIMKDAEFHITTARASGNELLARFVEVMTILLHDYMAKGSLVLGGINDALLRHGNVLDALRTRDPDIAEKAIRDHLIASRKSVEKYDSMQQEGKIENGVADFVAKHTIKEETT